MFSWIRRKYGLLTGDVKALRAELEDRDPVFLRQEQSRELIRMRSYAREKGIGPLDFEYPDMAYVGGEPPKKLVT